MTDAGHFTPDLIPSYREWAGSSQPKVARRWGYLYRYCTADVAAMLSTLFWPEFMEVRGCVLLSEHYDQRTFDEWWTHFGGQRRDVEMMINHTHMYDLFPKREVRDLDVSLPLYERLACVLERCWRAALREAFPRDRFEFSYGTEPEEYGPTVTFWRVASA